MKSGALSISSNMASDAGAETFTIVTKKELPPFKWLTKNKVTLDELVEAPVVKAPANHSLL